jgi:CRISPR/Cas system-associated protein Cas7 (RAMP superfamily)
MAEAKVQGGKGETGPNDEKLVIDAHASTSVTPILISETDTSETGSVRVGLLIPNKLYEDLQQILNQIGLWQNFSELIRSALTHERDRRIREALRKKKEAEGK